MYLYLLPTVAYDGYYKVSKLCRYRVNFGYQPAICIQQRIIDDVNNDFEPFRYQLETNNYYGDAFGFI